MTLQELIKEHGEPHALVDHWDGTSNPISIWGFEEIIIIDPQGKVILNGEHIYGAPLKIFQETLDKWKSKSDGLAAIGYISYDLKNLLFPHINFKKINKSTPLLWFAKPDKVIHYEINEDKEKIELPSISLVKDIPTPKDYERSIKGIKSFLEKGDSYQINYTQPKQYHLTGNSFNMYMSMRKNIQPYCGMYLNPGEMQILSFSPERFFRTSNRIIESYPMKGTRPRSHDLVQDERLAGELYNSKKDRAEHLMIVDLIRNDIGKVCEYGTINVDNLYGIESFETVHQMVSRVHGILSRDTQETHIIQALFPGGSITGAPKERSMEIIDSIENYYRGIYTGAIGSIYSNGNMDFNIAIRTMTINGNFATYPVGGGIVWDSESLDEWEESQQKSRIIDMHLNKIKPRKYQLEPY